MATSEHVIKVSADTSQFKRDLNRAKRSLQWRGIFLPMLVGAAIVTVGFVVGFVVGASA